MPEYVSGRPLMAKVLVENMMADAGIIKLIHDGSKEGSQIYTRKYKIFFRGRDTGNTMKFIYNKRDDWADISISEYNLVDLKFRQMLKGIQNDRIQVYEPRGNSQIPARNKEAGNRDDSQKPERISEGFQESKGQT